MEKDFENMPAHIFDWIETNGFNQLSDHQKKEVNRFFSEEEYNELHETAGELKSANSIPDHTTVASRQQAIRHFNALHHSAKNNRYLRFWQAAAAVLLLFSGWLIFQLAGVQQGSSVQISATDTVYVEKPAEIILQKVHDTIVVTQIKTKKITASASGEVIRHEPEATASAVGVMSLSQHKKLEGEGRRGCMKSDSLLRKFGFVSL